MILEYDVLETAFEIRAVKMDGPVKDAYQLELMHLCQAKGPETETTLDLSWVRCP